MARELFILLISFILSVTSHPGRPPIPDDPNARHLFETAEMNRTVDGFLTEAEVDDIFTKFDINEQKYVVKNVVVDITVDDVITLQIFTTVAGSDERWFYEESIRLQTRNPQRSSFHGFSPVFCYDGPEILDANLGDGRVNEMEFLEHWTNLKLGLNDTALVLFARADTDRDGNISRNPDMGRIFYYFDRDGDHKVSLPEFITVWFSLSS